jgi:hypothetical protein
MEPIPYRFNVKDRVVIKSDVTSMYPNARAYMEGTVERQRHDAFGYPHAYIKWDKTHWAYSGEEDGWTLEEHFEPVKEKKMADNKLDKDALWNLFEQFLAENENNEEDTTEPTEKLDEYEEKLRLAYEEAKEASAFVLVYVADAGGAIVPVALEGARDKQLIPILEAAMSDLAAQAHTATVLKNFQGGKNESR